VGKKLTDLKPSPVKKAGQSEGAPDDMERTPEAGGKFGVGGGRGLSRSDEKVKNMLAHATESGEQSPHYAQA